VVIVHVDLDPTILDSLLQTSLEISIPHSHKMIASKYTVRKHSMFHENAKDLAPYFVISCHFGGPLWLSDRPSRGLITASSEE